MKRNFFLVVFLLVSFVMPSNVFAFSSECTGGTITHSGGNTIHSFTSSGNFDCTEHGNGVVSVLVVAGGASGGAANITNSGTYPDAAGGGAGGIILDTAHAISASSYVVTVGLGGAENTSAIAHGNTGGDSLFDTLTAIGGGYGHYNGNGGTGGSGGGGANGGIGGSVVSDPVQGNIGGNSTSIGNQGAGGGGGGAGSAGNDGTGTDVGGNGGIGVLSSISGSSVMYACGGGGAGDSTFGIGGCASAGNGANALTSATAGLANTGSGGGGGATMTTSGIHYGAAGGSGIVIISYATPKTPQTISFDSLAEKIYGDADFSISATASSTLEVVFVASGTCTISGSLVHLTGVGTCTITASQAGDGTYDLAPDVARSFSVVDKTPPVLSGTPADITVSTSSHSGMAVTYTAPTATDVVDGSVSVSCFPASGANFPIGTSIVTCSASDVAENTATSMFNVIVAETESPVAPPVNMGNGAPLGTLGMIGGVPPTTSVAQGEVLGAATYKSTTSLGVVICNLSETQIQSLLTFLWAFGVGEDIIAEQAAALQS